MEKQQCVEELAARQAARQAGQDRTGQGTDHFGLRAVIAFCAVTAAGVAGEETYKTTWHHNYQPQNVDHLFVQYVSHV